MAARPWRLLITGPAPGPWNMAVDEAIMTLRGQGSSPPTLRLYAWSPPCLSVGYFQAVERDIDLTRLSQAGIDLVRRPTGGRAILHDDETTYSLVISQSHPLASGGVVESYRRISAGLVAGLRRLGLEVSAAPRRRDGQGRSAACFDTTSGYELTLAGRKLVGSAQMRRGGVLLQHGSVLLSVTAQPLFSLLRVEGEEERQRQAEAFGQRVISLREALGRDVPWGEVAEALAGGFEQALGITLRRGSLSEEERAQAEVILGDKYRNPEWNLRR